MQADAVLDEHPLEDRAVPQEALVLLGRAVVQDALDARAVVPAAVEQHDLPGCGQVLDVALEVPLAALALGGRRERHDPGLAGLSCVTRLIVEPLPAASRPSKTTTTRSLTADPLLHLDQLGLQAEQLGLVDRLLEALLLRHVRHRVTRGAGPRQFRGRPAPAGPRQLRW